MIQGALRESVCRTTTQWGDREQCVATVVDIVCTNLLISLQSMTMDISSSMIEREKNEPSILDLQDIEMGKGKGREGEGREGGGGELQLSMYNTLHHAAIYTYTQCVCKSAYTGRIPFADHPIIQTCTFHGTWTMHT